MRFLCTVCVNTRRYACPFAVYGCPVHEYGHQDRGMLLFEHIVVDHDQLEYASINNYR